VKFGCARDRTKWTRGLKALQKDEQNLSFLWQTGARAAHPLNGAKRHESTLRGHSGKTRMQQSLFPTFFPQSRRLTYFNQEKKNGFGE
jgi:hypothetical protein